MFNTKPMFMRIRRQRTNETLLLEFQPAFEIIIKYDEKQQFMTMLGQETFWKKNRLDLWRALKELELQPNSLNPDQRDKDSYTLLNDISFENTPIMLRTIKERLKVQVEQMIEQRRTVKTENWQYDDYNHIYQSGDRKFVSRAVQVRVPNHYIRTEDIEAFDRDFNKLLAKYQVKDPLRLQHGRKRFNFRTVANRYVERVYGFKPDKNDYYW